MIVIVTDKPEHIAISDHSCSLSNHSIVKQDMLPCEQYCVELVRQGSRLACNKQYTTQTKNMTYIEPHKCIQWLL